MPIIVRTATNRETGEVSIGRTGDLTIRLEDGRLAVYPLLSSGGPAVTGCSMCKMNR